MATKANLVIDQGADFSTVISIADLNDQAIDLSNYTGAAQIRKHYTSSNSVNFSVNVDGVTGEVTLALTAVQTEAMQGGRYVYDLEIISPTGVKSRIVEGISTVTPGVTRN